MDLSYVLIWMVGAGLVTLFLRSWQHPFTTGRAWRLICPAIALVMVATWKLAPNLTGPVGICLYVALVLLPSALGPWVDRLAGRGRFDRAKFLAQVARFVHPTEGMWDLPHLVSVLELWSRGDGAAATREWQKLSADRLVTLPFSRTLALQSALANAEWGRTAQWTSPTDSSDWWLDPHLPIYRMRALGELGRLEEQLEFFETFLLEHRPHPSAAPTAALFLFAFHGRAELVDELLQSSLVHIPRDSQKYWRATAVWFQGQNESAELILQELVRTGDARARIGAERRLQSSRTPLPLDPARHQRLDELFRILQNYLQQEARPTKRTGTHIIMALLIAVFATEEWLGGSTKIPVLLRLGAAHPEFFKMGEWWRLLTAGLLHFGAVHLAMNLLGMFFLGPVVETLLGTIKYLILFTVCIVASVAGVTGIAVAGWMEPQIMIGASGGVMGMVGWLAAYFLREWLRFRTPVNRQRMQALGTALLIQVAFDLSTENVSFAGHVSGMLAGFTFGMIHRPKKD